MTAAAILAATFTIAFEGLIMVQTESTGYRNLAVVDAYCELHKACIEIWDTANGTPRYECKEIPLEKDDHVSFLNIPRGPIETDKLYERHVPHITSYIVQGDVDGDVVDKATTTRGVWAFVDLPGGDILTTFGNFDDRVRLTRNRLFLKKKNVCFARFTVLNKAPYDDDAYVVITRKGQDIKYQFYANDLIIVSNISADPHPHFPLYEKLLTEDGKLGASKILYDKKCEWEESEDIPDNVKKILLKLKPRVPNGDCGSVGNP